jgi:CDP-paratose 2-epimerase
VSIVVVTGSCGLVGSETVSFFCRKNFDVVGIDNNMREYFFGPSASVQWNKKRLQKQFKRYRHRSVDIRSESQITALFKRYGKQISLIVHTAAQPSHDWSATQPRVDFDVNALGTSILLEAFRKFCPKAVFILVSTNKVYGDRPNSLPLIEKNKRFELPSRHEYYRGIDESMSIDSCLHSVFGATKVAADILTQEYGKYFGLRTGVFRGGCLTGPAHAGAELHGFLSYLVRCCITETTYRIYGYKGKQVRDNIHSFDLVNAFYAYFKNPRYGEVYNMGGGRFANISVLEAIDICQELCSGKLRYEYRAENRKGDHMWWISDVSKFKKHYPSWKQTYTIRDTIAEIYSMQKGLLLK